MITLLDLEFESVSQNNSDQYTSELIKSQRPVTDTRYGCPENPDSCDFYFFDK